jgi:hypothetical protein
MSEALILQLLNIVPSLFATVQQLIANGQIKDQATLDAAIKAQQAAAQTDLSQLLTDLGPAT